MQKVTLTALNVPVQQQQRKPSVSTGGFGLTLSFLLQTDGARRAPNTLAISPHPSCQHTQLFHRVLPGSKEAVQDCGAARCALEAETELRGWRRAATCCPNPTSMPSRGPTDGGARC